MTRRLSLVFAIILLLMLGVLSRALFLQIFPSEKLSERKQRQFQTAITLQPRRGLILDRNNKELASSVNAYSFFADPKIIKNKKQFAREVAKVLGISRSYVYKKIRNSNRRFVWIARKKDRSTKKKLEALNFRGLGIIEESKRIYPNLHILSQTLGFVGAQGDGLEGLELLYDKELSGKDEEIQLKRDARGTPLILNGQLIMERSDGKHIQLTTDLELQYVLEQALKQATRKHEAKKAVGVILKADTSEILSLASYPTFDANEFLKSSAKNRRNRVIQDAFEPGSTMKTFTVAAALKKNIFHPKSKIYCEKGELQVGGRTIKEADKDHDFEWLRLEEILAKSSNVGTAKVAFKLGEDDLYRTLRDFGFGQKISELPGESKGILNEIPWRKHTLATISFGHGIAATPLQIANAYAAIANGGVLNQPYIVKSILNSRGEILEEMRPKELRRVLSPVDAEELRDMLKLATSEDGTGVKANIKGYSVAGKTGTAQRVSDSGRGYEPGKYISSFAGFVPAENPKYVIYIAIDSPKGIFYGSEVAAPIFSQIANFAMLRNGAPAHYITEEKMQKATDRSASLWQQSAAIDLVKREMQEGQMPDLKGLTLRQSLQLLRGENLDVKIHGTGRVTKTLPEKGKSLDKSKTINIYLKKEI